MKALAICRRQRPLQIRIEYERMSVLLGICDAALPYRN
jgi:hypothetical protein